MLFNKKYKNYPLVISFEDGCVFQMAGMKHDAGWKLELPGGCAVVCPHGEEMTVMDTYRKTI